MTDFESVLDAHAAWAARYDTDENRTRDLDGALLQAADLPLEGADVVEFGAGTGKNTAYLATRAARVIAFDLSDAMLAMARDRQLGSHVVFAVHDVAEPWPVKAATADLVIGTLALDHVADLSPVFLQARRALRPGGLLYVSELHPYRQRRGGGVAFEDATGLVRVEAYVHSTADYVGAGLRAGLLLTGLAEVGDAEGDQPGEPALPRILQIVFAAPMA